jgi:CheY-like chemotaxis protein
VFFAELPRICGSSVAEGSALALANMPEARGLSAAGHVLVVDDNPVNVKLLRLLLEGEGYQVHTAEGAESALRALAQRRPELILMDVQLRGVDGLELTRRLKADTATAAIPVVAVTAYAMKGDEERALAAGCDGYLPKPIDTNRLLELVSRFVRPRGAP